jgi:hypothetical protein
MLFAVFSRIRASTYPNASAVNPAWLVPRLAADALQGQRRRQRGRLPICPSSNPSSSHSFALAYVHHALPTDQPKSRASLEPDHLPPTLRGPGVWLRLTLLLAISLLPLGIHLHLGA